MESITQFGENIVYSLQGTDPCEYDFECIKKVVSAKNSYILCFKKTILASMDARGKAHHVTKKGAIPLSREGFTQGNFEDFKKFLAEKCPGVKIPE